LAIDREATLKNAEKFLRVGRLDAAIGEYARVVEDQPKDWNSANALGDLYVRAGQPDKAVTLYRRIAEHLLAEGFYPKAGALFKKILKIRADDEQSQIRLAEIAALQGLLADAKAYYAAIASRRRQRGDAAGADEIVVRVGRLDPDDLQARRAGAQASERIGDTVGAAQQFRELYDAFVEQGLEDDAAAVLKDCVRCRPDAKDPVLMLPLAGIDLREGRFDQARAALTEVATSGSAARDRVVDLAWKLVPTHPDAAAVCANVVADAFVGESEFDGAVRVLQEFTMRAPGQLPSLLRLVEVCVDGGLESEVSDAQARLADAYLAAGNADEARVIAEDLASRNPSDAAHIARLRRALELLKVDDIDAEIEARLAPSLREPLDSFDDLIAQSARARMPALDQEEPVDRLLVGASEPAPVLAERPVPMISAAGPARPADVVQPVATEKADKKEFEADPALVEIDLTVLLGELQGQAPAPGPVRHEPPDLESVFARMRHDAAGSDRSDESGDYFALARTYIEMGLPQEAIGSLEIAARSPQYRFAASCTLAQLYRDASDLALAIEWLERAAEVPAPGPDEARGLLYDLADVLETVGEPARALAVLMELNADAPGYRDVPDRVRRLSRLETGG
jgi:tetratricopeptide (TPR) repeat protein